MTRAVLFRAICGGLGILAALGQEPPKQLKAPAQQQEQEPPEEDAALKPTEYTFNPLQAEKEMNVGHYYLRTKRYKAAANRFREASRWNPALAEAFLRLGEAEEKLKDKKAAQEAYARYLELAPDGKDAGLAKKKLGASAPFASH